MLSYRLAIRPESENWCNSRVSSNSVWSLGLRNRFFWWFLLIWRLLSIGMADVRNEKNPPEDDLLALGVEEILEGAWRDPWWDPGGWGPCWDPRWDPCWDTGFLDDPEGVADVEALPPPPPISTLCHARLDSIGLQLLSWLPNFWAILFGVPSGEGM